MKVVHFSRLTRHLVPNNLDGLATWQSILCPSSTPREPKEPGDPGDRDIQGTGLRIIMKITSNSQAYALVFTEALVRRTNHDAKMSKGQLEISRTPLRAFLLPLTIWAVLAHSTTA